MIITDNQSEQIKINSDEERVALTFINKVTLINRTIILNEREAFEVYDFIGKWIKGGKK